MVRDTANSVFTIVEQVIGSTPSLQIEIVYPNELEMLQMQQPIISPGTDFGNEDMYDPEYMYDPDYYCGPLSDYFTTFKDELEKLEKESEHRHIDVRKQETRDREKDNTHRRKRREAQLIRKANKTNARQKEQDVREKKRRSKKSERRGSHGQDFALC